ncbi:chaperone modulator CbpM [Dethiobacter alkaliphilus]|uniref:MerR family transcriptional regulator n=1 Tax=Dethiobacter alkaliphilus AHT 1 TaxID=555088 RepID=C0GCW1_DETAL|nr:chaperone modulator CbpM [Dethiobacter alkaliphilus]EEG79046.1 conserved hypothetical protein [Dethiobacter alkaliphilus AHT 1]
MKRYWIQTCKEDVLSKQGWVSIHTLEYHPELLQRLALLGVVEIRHERIHTREINRLKKLLCLRRSLGVNTAGAVIILDLLEKVESLQEQVRQLQEE